MSNEIVKVPSFGSEMAELLKKYYVEELSGLSALTLKVRRTDLKKFLLFFQEMYGSLDLKFWYPHDSKRFVDELSKQGYAPAYVNRNLASIKSFGRWLWENNYIQHNPVKGLREIQIDQAQPKALKDKEWFRFQKASELLIAKPRSKYAQDFRNKVIALTLEASGLRIEEVLSLSLEQFVGNKFVNVRTKGNKVRASVSIKKEVADFIREYASSYRTNGSKILFTNRYGQRISRNGVAQALNKIAHVANGAFSEGGSPIKIHPHKFRHTHAKKLYDNTHDPLLVAKRLGHNSGTKYVSRYASVVESQIDEAIEKI